MNRMSFMFAGLVVGLAAGFLAGWILFGQGTPAAGSADAPAGRNAGAPQATPSAAHGVGLSHPAAAKPATAPAAAGTPGIPGTAPAAAGLPSTNTPLRPMADDGTVRIPRRFLTRIQCPVFNTASNCLTEDIVELLQLSPEERDRLNQLIVSTRNRVEEHELERAVVMEQSPQRVVLKIAANADQGREMEDAFSASVQEALGDRAAAFLERARPYQASLFSSFGKNETVLTVTREEKSNLLRVQSRQDYSAGGASRGSFTSTTVSDQMPDRWKKFFQ
jgi:hypothetical protein